MKNLKKASEKAAPPKRGKRFSDKRGSEKLAERQASRGWPLELGPAVEALAALELDTSASCLNAGKPANFLGHLDTSKSAAVDMALVEAVTTGSLDEFITKLSATLVTGSKRNDTKALKAKLYSHDRHYNGDGKVSFNACLTHAGLAGRYGEIQPAFANLLGLIRKTL